MPQPSGFVAALCFAGFSFVSAKTEWPGAEAPLTIKNDAGLQLVVARENAQPVLRIVLPGQSESNNAIEVIFPEHVTARRRGSSDSVQMYMFRPGPQGKRPTWRRVGPSLEYECELPAAVRMLARATLEDDGVRFHYQFSNRSDVAYEMIYAVTDPRLTSVFHDVRLERTYVHHTEGFDLLASETPDRLTLPLSQWLPSRYLASFIWPVPAERVERRGDGISYYNKSRRVDIPLIATFSMDRTWVVASFTRETGNVWSNPQLTCQHVDPQISLAPGQDATLEVKILVLRGSLNNVLEKAIQQRNFLR